MLPCVKITCLFLQCCCLVCRWVSCPLWNWNLHKHLKAICIFISMWTIWGMQSLWGVWKSFGLIKLSHNVLCFGMIEEWYKYTLVICVRIHVYDYLQASWLGLIDMLRTDLQPLDCLFKVIQLFQTKYSSSGCIVEVLNSLMFLSR